MKKILFAVAVTAIVVVASSFREAAAPAPVEHYSVDQLPATWKANKSLIRAIDGILSATVKELSQSIACENCTSPYYVDVLIDSAVVLKQNVHKKSSDGYAYECVTKYAFKSSLAVYDANKHGVSKVQVTDPLVDEFHVVKKFNIDDPALAKDPKAYAAAHPEITDPSKQDQLDQTEKAIYKLRDNVQKLMKRRL